jgi:hypothetical protein
MHSLGDSDQNVSVEHDSPFKSQNLQPETLMSWNGLTLAHSVGWFPGSLRQASLAPYPT